MASSIPTYQWVTSNEQLANLCKKLKHESAIALDTEFIRTNTFYPKTALIQIAAADGAYLIDPLTIADFEPLRDIFRNTNIVKVLHSCSEDLEVFNNLLQTLPTPLFDSQIAAAIANIGFSMSYSALVRELIGVELPKGETRSDWLARPLRPEQEHYAALDVVHLLELYKKLENRLQQLDRLSWLQEECAELISNAAETPDPENYYQKIKAAWKLNAQQLSVLQALSSWREIKARQIDKPRNHIVPEKVLFEVAKTLADTPIKVRQLMPGPLGRYKKQAEPVAEIVKCSIDAVEKSTVAKLPVPLSSSSKEMVKRIKALAEQVSEEQGIPNEVLLKKNDVEAFVRSGLKTGEYILPPRLHGWRRTVIGDQLLAIANELKATETATEAVVSNQLSAGSEIEL